MHWITSFVPLLHMEYLSGEPYFLDHMPFKSCLYHPENVIPMLLVKCEKGEKLTPLTVRRIQPNDWVSTKSKCCRSWFCAQIVDIFPVEKCPLWTSTFLFKQLSLILLHFYILCHLDTPKSYSHDSVNVAWWPCDLNISQITMKRF